MRIDYDGMGYQIAKYITKNMGKSTNSAEKLASGLRINKAGDDAAGLAISQRMQAQIRGLRQASRNARNAQSMLGLAEATLNEITNVIQRMRQLSLVSLNGTLTDDDREKVQDEFKSLQDTLDDFTTNTQWNTEESFEAHMPAFSQIKGNRILDGAIEIEGGVNDNLEIVVDGISKQIYLDEGVYTAAELADMIDDKLMAADPNLIINLTKDNTLTLQAENSLSIDRIKGGAASLFYEYVLGNPPGMVIGVTEFTPEGRLEIKTGVNDKLSFYYGSETQYVINFAVKDGGYSIDELVDIINEQLAEQGATEVKAIKYNNNKNIALYSDKNVITGLNGNIIQIDGTTSALYDNAKWGTVTKTQGYVLGKADLANGLTVKKDQNDTLSFSLDGQSKTIKLLDETETEKSYTLIELVQKLNDEFAENNIAAAVKTYTDSTGTHIRLESNWFGTGSSIQLNTASNAYNDLFVRRSETTTVTDPTLVTGNITTAQVKGKYGIGNTTKIISGQNDTLTFTVDGITKSITLAQNDYTKNELVNEINSQLLSQGLDIKVSLSSDIQGGYSALIFTHNQAGAGHSFSIASGSNAFTALLCNITYTAPTIINGTTTIIYPPEGLVTPPTIITTPAAVVGKADLSTGITIDDTNNILSFKVNSKSVNLILDKKTYSSAGEFLSMISAKLSGTGITAGLKDGKYLQLTTVEEGKEQVFSNLGGNAYNTVLAGKGINVPSPLSSSGTTTNSYILGKNAVTNNYVIDDTNNTLNFSYIRNGATYDLNVVLTEKTYGTITDLAAELESKINDALSAKGISDTELTAMKDSNQYIKIMSNQSGSDYKLQNFSGGFYEKVLKKTVTTSSTSNPDTSKSVGSTTMTESYIVGREDMNKDLVINPYINDTFIFDFRHDDDIETFELTLAPGHYTESSMVAEINSKLREALIAKGYDADMLTAQIGGVESNTYVDDTDKLVIKYNSKNDGIDNSGTYIIDGVRGNAAYTIFYKAVGEPSPTHTVGIVDLSQGATIQAGVNDTFAFDVNGVEKKIVLSAGSYTADALLTEINNKLNAVDANFVASYYDGRLKLSCKELGMNTIDGIRGNAAGTLFFEIENRATDMPNTFQVGANSGQNLVFDKTRLSIELMRINTVMITTDEHAQKALNRIDYALNQVNEQRSLLGAAQNSLDRIIEKNENYESNLVDSDSRIEDVDMAKEIMNKVHADILLRSSQAMLVHYNSSAKEVLALLRPEAMDNRRQPQL